MEILAQAESAGRDIGVGLVIVGFVLYFIPSIVGIVRSVPNVGSVIVINLFLGWSIIGWVVALAMAVRTVPPPSRPPTYPPSQPGSMPPPP